MTKKLTVIQMAQHLGVSKEAIYNRIRRGSLHTIIENGKKYVLLTDELEKSSRKKKTNNENSNNEYMQHLKQELQELKEKNHKLENDKEKLQKEKEELLETTRVKIEAIYQSRDEYIQSILSLINVPSISSGEDLKEEVVEVNEVDEDEVDIVEQICESYEDWIELKEYLSQKDYSKKEKKNLIKKIYAYLGKSKYLKEKKGEIFIKKGVKLKKIFHTDR